MKTFYYKCVLISELLTCLYCAHPNIYENSTCRNVDGMGVCTKLIQCNVADDQVNQFGTHNFTRCGFTGIYEIVCCPILHTLRSTNITSTRRKSEQACEEFLQTFNNIVFPHIAGGRNATLGEFPFMAALAFYSESRKEYQFRCGGSLISDRYILTAAHCLWNLNQEEVKFVRLGVFNVPEYVEELDKTVDIKVKTATIHDNYKRRSSENDIALIELEKPVKLSYNLRPACLFSNTKNYPEEFIIIGWGAMDQDGRNHTILQKGFVNFVQFKNCSLTYARMNRNLVESQLCAGSKESDICMGDSGGPLLMRNSHMPVVVGIISFGETGCLAGRTSVYTSVSKHLDWIEDIVWK